ncbi:MAG: hypothetical protein KatS3mg064_0605 [Tepidiforma sp.]|nr:MAG: hypothetical protein KatS3mg064_0605 [Tepidiforma sp.]
MARMGFASTGKRVRMDRRAERTTYDPLRQRAKLASDLLWERARRLADIIAPAEPMDEEPLTDRESWMILEAAALTFSPWTWEDPEALEDLYRLRKQFAPGAAKESLRERAKLLRRDQAMLPDPAITPQNPEFERRMRRLKG